MITAFYTAILACGLIFLTLRIVKRRMKYKIGLGDGGNEDLRQAMRIHGNFTELMPFCLLLMLLLELQYMDPVYLHIAGITLVMGRILHFLGLSQSPLTTKGRFWGTFLTICTLGLTAAANIILYVLSGL